MSSKIDDPRVLFERWFDAAFLSLFALPDGDGAIAGMMVALPLFERFIHVKMRAVGGGWTFYQHLASELLLSDAEEAKEFWTAFRHGFCHAGMPFEEDREKRALPRVSLSGGGPKLPRKISAPNGPHVFLLDPWKFIFHVRDIYRANPALLTQHGQAPLMPIHVA